MHLCYVDDSGDPKRGGTLSAILIDSSNWASVLDYWLRARYAVRAEFGVMKNAELHANKLFKGRGSFCETVEENNRFGETQRDAAARIMLNSISRAPVSAVITVGSSDRSAPVRYQKFIEFIERWASEQETEVIVFYDGQQGLADDGSTVEEQQEMWKQAVRNAKPYRDVHRDLDITERRIVEDVIMQDSRYNQLIQAADLIAYGAFQKHAQEHPEMWTSSIKPNSGAIKAYMRTRNHWLPDSDYGMHWL